MLNASATLDAPRAKLTCTFPEETIRGPLTSQCGGNAVSAECGNTWRRVKTTLNFTSTLASDDMSITTGTYALATPERACFPAGANGTFSGYKIASATGNW